MNVQAYSFLSSAGKSDLGRNPKRPNNEDAILLMPEHGAFCVSDGMGGLSRGELASQMAIESVRSALSDELPEWDLDKRVAITQEALRSADIRIKSLAAEKPGQRMGATVVAILFAREHPHRGCILHAGDSRAYRYRGGRLEQLTVDHSVAQAVHIAPERLPPAFRNGVTNGLGCSKDLEIEQTVVGVRTADLYLLCTDGLSQMLPDKKLQTLLREQADKPLDVLCEVLVDAANEAGGKDNISVVLMSVGDIGANLAGETTGSTDRTTATDDAGFKISRWERLRARLLAYPRPWLLAVGGLLLLAVLLGVLKAYHSRQQTPALTEPASEPVAQPAEVIFSIGPESDVDAPGEGNEP